MTLKYQLPNTLSSKKPVLKQKELEQLLRMQLPERTPLLEMINPYLHALNRYKINAEKRLSAVEKLYPIIFHSLQIIKKQAYSSSIPESQTRKQAATTAIETLKQIILCYKHCVQSELNALKTNTKKLTHYCFSILEMCQFLQYFMASRFQKLPANLWEDINLTWYFGQRLLDVHEIQTPLTVRYEINHHVANEPSISNLTIYIHLFSYLEISSWANNHMVIFQRYFNQTSAHLKLNTQSKKNNNLLIHPELCSQLLKFQEETPKNAHFLDPAPFLQNILRDHKKLTLLTDNASTKEKPPTFSNLIPSFASTLCQMLIRQLMGKNQLDHTFTSNMEPGLLYTDWSDCILQFRQFDEKIVTKNHDAEYWYIIDKRKSYTRFKALENKSMMPVKVGNICCYTNIENSVKPLLGIIENIFRNSDNEIEISVQMFPENTDAMIIREVDPDLKEKQWLTGGFLTKILNHDYLILATDKPLLEDRTLIIYLHQDKIPFTTQGRLTTWPHLICYKSKLDTANIIHTAVEKSKPIMTQEEFLVLPESSDDQGFSVSLDAYDEEEITLTLDTKEPTPAERQDWKVNDLIHNHFRIHALLEESLHYKRYQGYHIHWDCDILIEVFNRSELDNNFATEITQWHELGSHENLLRCFYLCIDEEKSILFSEFPVGLSLQHLLSHQQQLNLSRCLDIAIQFLRALHYCHQHQFPHPQLSAQHIWLDNNQHCKLGQFFSYQIAPEGTKEKNKSTNIDVFSSIMQALLLSEEEKTSAGAQFIALLKTCQTNNAPDFSGLMKRLQDIHHHHNDTPYARNEVDVNPIDNFNHQALVLFDLAQKEQAELLWASALEEDPKHFASRYNLNCYHWRTGKITDLEMIAIIKANESENWYHQYLYASIEIERGNYNHAIEILDNTLALPKVKRLLDYALGLEQQTRQLEQTFSSQSITAYSCKTADSRQFLVSGHSNGTLKLWNIQSWQHIFVIEAFDESVTCIDICAPQALIIASSEKHIKLFSLDDGELKSTIKQSHVNHLTLSGDGKMLLFSRHDKIARCWSLTKNQLELTLSGHRGNISKLAFHPDNRLVASASEDRTIKLWDITLNQNIHTLRGHSGLTHDLKFCGAQARLYSAIGKKIIVWNTQTGNELHQFNGHQDDINYFAIDKSERYLISVSKDKTIRLWHVEKAQCIVSLRHKVALHYCSFIDAAKYALSIDDNGFQLWHMNAEHQPQPATNVLCPIPQHSFYVEVLEQYDTALQKANIAFEQKLYKSTLRYALKARKMPEFNHDPEALKYWSVLYRYMDRLYLQDSWQLNRIEMEKGSVAATHISASSQFMLAGNDLGVLQSWELVTGQYRCIKNIQAHQARINAIDLNAKENKALTCSVDKKIKYWDLTKQQSCIEFKAHENAVNAVKFIIKDHFFLSASDDKTVKLWNINAQKCIKTYPHQSPVKCLAISHDHTSFVAAGGDDMQQDYCLVLWDLFHAKALHTYEGHQGKVNSLCFSPDQQSIYSASDDGSIKQWQTHSGECIDTIFQEHCAITKMVISSDGDYLLFGNQDGHTYFYNIKHRNIEKLLSGHHQAISSVFLSQDNQYAMSADHSNTIILWYLDWQLYPAKNNEWRWNITPWLNAFLNRHAIPSNENCLEIMDLMPIKNAVWSMDDFLQLTYALGDAGFAWIEVKSLWPKLNEFTENRKALAHLNEQSSICTHCGTDYQLPPYCLHCGEAFDNKDKGAEKLNQAIEILHQGKVTEALALAQQMHDEAHYQKTKTVGCFWADLYVHCRREKLLDYWQTSTEIITDNTITVLKFSRCNRYLCLGMSSGQLIIHGISAGELQQSFIINAHQGEVTSLAISADETQILSAGKDGKVKLWDIKLNQILQNFAQHEGAVNCCQFLNHQRYIISAGDDKTIRIWDIQNAKCLQILNGHNNKILALDVSSDDCYLVSAGGDDLGYRDNSVKLWDLRQADILRTFEQHSRPVKQVCFANNGQTIYSAGADEVVLKWNIQKGSCELEYNQHQASLLQISLSQDDQYCLSASQQKVMFWDVNNSEPLFEYIDSENSLTTIDLSNDCHYMATANSKGVKLWHLDWQLSRKEAYWDWQSMPWLNAWLNHKMTSQETAQPLSFLHKNTQPQWTKQQFSRLLQTLGFAGFGGFDTSELENYLKTMAQSRTQQVSIIDKTTICTTCNAINQSPPCCLQCKAKITETLPLCSECEYQRQVEETTPNWQCPRCGMDY